MPTRTLISTHTHTNWGNDHAAYQFTVFFRQGNNKARIVIKPLEIKLSGSNTLALLLSLSLSLPLALSLSLSHTQRDTHICLMLLLLQNWVEGAFIILQQVSHNKIIIPEHKWVKMCFSLCLFFPATLSSFLSLFLLSLNGNVCNTPRFGRTSGFFVVFLCCVSYRLLVNQTGQYKPTTFCAKNVFHEKCTLSVFWFYVSCLQTAMKCTFSYFRHWGDMTCIYDLL